PAASTPNVDENDEDLKRAIELSIQEAQHKPNYADYSLNPKIIGDSTFGDDDVDDPDLRAAIEASLQDVPGGGAGGSDVRVPDYLPATSTAMQVGLHSVNEDSAEDNTPLAAFMPAAKIAEEEDAGPLTNTERENVQLFESLLLRIRDSGQDINNDPQIQYLHESIDQLHPKITDAIDVVDQKQKEFSKLHHRIITATKIYEQLLDKRLRSSTYMTASSAPVSNPGAYQNTLQSIYPVLSSAQQPTYAPPAQTQYNQVYPAQHGQQDPQRHQQYQQQQLQQQQQQQQPLQYNQFPEQQQQHAHAAGNAPQGQYPLYNEPQQLSRSGSVYQQSQQQPQQLSPNNPFTAPNSAYSAAPTQLYNTASRLDVGNMNQPQTQPQPSLVGPSSSTNAYYSTPASSHIPSIPPLQPTSVRHVDSTQMSTTPNVNTTTKTVESEPEEALLIEF
ncbi:Vacuolar protein-sorting-associated protein 27, partial [Coemansia sp. RSA 2559]